MAASQGWEPGSEDEPPTMRGRRKLLFLCRLPQAWRPAGEASGTVSRLRVGECGVLVRDSGGTRHWSHMPLVHLPSAVLRPRWISCLLPSSHLPTQAAPLEQDPGLRPSSGLLPTGLTRASVSSAVGGGPGCPCPSQQPVGSEPIPGWSGSPRGRAQSGRWPHRVATPSV